MHASRSDPEDAFDVPEIALSMPPRAASVSSIAAPEPLVDDDSQSFLRLSALSAVTELAPLDEEELDDEPLSLPPPTARSRWRVPHFIIAVSAVICVVTVVLALRDRARESALFRTAQANRARAAVSAMAPPRPAPPALPVADGAPRGAPLVDAAQLAAAAEARLHETAKGERFEAQVALEMGDVVRAARVAQQSVWHDPREADGWLLLTAAQLELNRIEASRTSLQACADNATHGPRWECLALMHDNGPEGFTP